MEQNFDTPSFISGAMVFFMCLIFYRLWMFIKHLKPKNPEFKMYSIRSEVPLYFSFLNNNNMKQVIVKDTGLAGKTITASAILAADTAGNIPDTKEGSSKGTSSDESVATAEPGPIDSATGKHSVIAKPTGKKGNAIITYSVNPDLDGSGDADISFSFLLQVQTEEATGFSDDTVEVGEPV